MVSQTGIERRARTSARGLDEAQFLDGRLNVSARAGRGSPGFKSPIDS
jgi:hypothetical protein